MRKENNNKEKSQDEIKKETNETKVEKIEKFQENNDNKTVKVQRIEFEITPPDDRVLDFSELDYQ